MVVTRRPQHVCIDFVAGTHVPFSWKSWAERFNHPSNYHEMKLTLHMTKVLGARLWHRPPPACMSGLLPWTAFSDLIWERDLNREWKARTRWLLHCGPMCYLEQTSPRTARGAPDWVSHGSARTVPSKQGRNASEDPCCCWPNSARCQPRTCEPFHNRSPVASS